MSASNQIVSTIMNRLSALSGSWIGRGEGRYPTIESFVYRELLTFEVNLHYPMLHYEQRTLLLPDEEPAHWESGFIRPLADGQIEISNAQDSGRTEVLRGSFENDSLAGQDFVLELFSVAHCNDDRLIETSRRFTLKDNSLHYEKRMTTTTTQQPASLVHLEALLSRVKVVETT